jgi:predicted RNase H-like nuclease
VRAVTPSTVAGVDGCPGPFEHQAVLGGGPPSTVAGVDGCPGGWVIATAACTPGGPVAVEVSAGLGELVGRLVRGGLAAAAVDLPIGLPARGPRRCDLEARALLGPRRSTVFPAPVRAALGAADHAEACARSRAAAGRGMSVQTFNLLARIADLDRLLPRHRPVAAVEAHPELAFLRLAGRPLPPKRSPEGRRARLAALAAVVGADTDLAALARAARAPLVDVIDACALVATARRLAAGTAERLGGGEVDPTGRPMEMAW